MVRQEVGREEMDATSRLVQAGEEAHGDSAVRGVVRAVERLAARAGTSPSFPASAPRGPNPLRMGAVVELEAADGPGKVGGRGCSGPS
jgi:hypothetical protein